MALRPDSEHRSTRGLLRIVGPMVLGIGVLFMITGLVDFFSAFGSMGQPRLFWCFFVGMPLMFVGTVLCKFAFIGAVTRYMANEVAPVGKDTVNYMVDGTKDSIRDVATAVGEGFAAARGGGGVEVLRCHKCNEQNEASANFCNGCGAALSKSVACAGCGELNDPDAKFCDNCGQAIA